MTTCPRCGREVKRPEALAAVARRARVALDRMRLAVPAEVVLGVRELDAALACWAELCPLRRSDG